MSNVPNLRFPEFEGEWEEKEIGNTLKIGNGRDYQHLKSGEIPVYGTGGYMTSVDNYLFEGESVCIGRKGTINNPFFLTGKFWTVDTLFYTYDYNDILPKFLFYTFKQINWLKYNEASGVPSLSKKTIEKISIGIPKREEQNKIASFLSLIDQRIETQNKIIEKYESLIKGLSEKLFNMGIRFKNGDTDFPNWEILKVEDVLEPTPAKKYQINSSEICSRGKYRVVDQGKEMIAGYSNNENNVFNNYPVIIFGDHTTALKYIDFEFIVGADGTKLLKNKREDSLKYLYYNLYYNNVKQDGYKRHYSILSKTYLQLPSVKEQIIIASFLSKIDERNEIETGILKQYESQKNYLLQNCFI